MKCNPYLSFNGNAAEAMSFYQKCLGNGGKLNLQFHRDSPMAETMPPEMRDKVLHAHLQVGDLVLMASDIASEHYTAPSPMMQISLLLPTDKEAEAAFAALSEGATVSMPIQQTFWTSRFGMLRDKFGVPWMVSSEQNH